MKFAMQGAQDNGEFFTAPSMLRVVRVVSSRMGTPLIMREALRILRF